MNAPESVTDAQLRHLLDVVDRHREERCQELLEQARGEAGQLVKQAYRDARSRLHQDVLETRESVRRRLVSAEARRQTQLRQQRQRTDQEMLARIWQPLVDALLRRWRQKELRKQWVDALVQQALSTLIDTDWCIDHPEGWSAEERSALETRLGAKARLSCRFAAKPGMSAGIRICAGNTCVDGTIEGLLRERSRVEALLLASMNSRRAGGD